MEGNTLQILVDGNWHGVYQHQPKGLDINKALITNLKFLLMRGQLKPAPIHLYGVLDAKIQCFAYKGMPDRHFQ